MCWKGNRGRSAVLLLFACLQVLQAQDQACIDALLEADVNGDGLINRTEYISLMGNLSPYEGCPDTEDASAFSGLGPFSLAFEGLSCLCQRYDPSDPNCCSGTNKGIAVPGVYPDSYTSRVCTTLSDTIDSECEEFAPQPTISPTSSPTDAPTAVPTIPPTITPPTGQPTIAPTAGPSDSPTAVPITATPSTSPSDIPTTILISAPTVSPTAISLPTSTAPSTTPTALSDAPTTSVPSATPSRSPTSQIGSASNTPTASPVSLIVEVPTDEESPKNGSPTDGVNTDVVPFERGIPNEDDDKNPVRIIVPVVFGATVVLLAVSLLVYRRRNAEKQNRFSTLAKGALQEDLEAMDPTNESDDTDVPPVGSPQRMGYLLSSLLVDEEQASAAATNQSEQMTLGSKSLKSSESRSSLEIFEHDDTGSDSSSGVLVIARSKSPRSPVKILDESRDSVGVTAKEDDSSQWMEFHAPDSDGESKETVDVVKKLDDIFKT